MKHGVNYLKHPAKKHPGKKTIVTSWYNNIRRLKVYISFLNTLLWTIIIILKKRNLHKFMVRNHTAADVAIHWVTLNNNYDSNKEKLTQIHGEESCSSWYCYSLGSEHETCTCFEQWLCWCLKLGCNSWILSLIY